MGIVNDGLTICAAAMAGSYTENHWIAIGQGGSEYTSSDTSLENEFGRQQINDNDLSVPAQVTLIANWSPSQISGCILREHGVSTLGSMFLSRNIITGSIIFDGEQELQIQETIKFFI